MPEGLMVCPDCGGVLSQISIANFDTSFRCIKCGGFFTQSWVVNRMPDKAMDHWPVMEYDRLMAKLGSGECPRDKKLMERYVGPSVPKEVTVFVCKDCKWWWWPEDTLNRYKPAQTAKKDYFKTWGKVMTATLVMLPMLGILVLVGGVGVALNLMQSNQRTVVNAGSGIRNFSAVYLGGGKAIISFSGQQKITTLSYRQGGEIKWMRAEVSWENGVSIVRLENLEKNSIYVVDILGGEYTFKTN